MASPPSSCHLSSPCSSEVGRPRSPHLSRREEGEEGGGSIAGKEKKTSVFHPIPEIQEDDKDEEEAEGKNDDNNNAAVDNKNQISASLTVSRRKATETRKTSQYDVNTILDELDSLALRRDSSPPSGQPSPPSLSRRPAPQLPRTARELIQRRKSLLIHLNDWYSDLYWPYDEEETVLGLRYTISGRTNKR